MSTDGISVLETQAKKNFKKKERKKKRHLQFIAFHSPFVFLQLLQKHFL